MLITTSFFSIRAAGRDYFGGYFKCHISSQLALSYRLVVVVWLRFLRLGGRPAYQSSADAKSE